MLIIDWIIIVLLSVSGILSGGWQPVPHIHKTGSPLTGLCIGYLLGVTGYWLLGAIVVGWLVEKLSPAKYSHGLILDNYGGTPSYERESAFFEIRKRRYLEFNLAVRGFASSIIWALFLILINIQPSPAVFGYIVAWPLAAHIGRLSGLGDPWHQRISEGTRQLIAGLIIMGVNYA